MTPAPPTRSSGRTTTLLLAVLVALGGLLVVGGGSPAAARADGCGPVDLADASAVQEEALTSDVVFYARLRGQLAIDPQTRIATWQVQVVDPLGSALVAGDRPRVRFDLSMAEDDTRVLRVGQLLVLFATRPADARPEQQPGQDSQPGQDPSGRPGDPLVPQVLDVDLCDGVGVSRRGELRAAELAELARTVATAGEETDGDGSPSAEVAFEDRDATSISLRRTLAPGAALVLAGFLGLMLVSRLGRARR